MNKRIERLALEVAGWVAIVALRGYRIVPGKFADSEDSNGPRVCLCGSILLATGVVKTASLLEEYEGPEIIRMVARRLKISVAQAGSLNNGFEGYPRVRVKGAADLGDIELDKEWYRIGKAFRRQWERRIAA